MVKTKPESAKCFSEKKVDTFPTTSSANFEIFTISSSKTLDSASDKSASITSTKPEKELRPETKSTEHDETFFRIFIQIVVPFFLAGIGTCGAGIVLDSVEEWEVFKVVTELFILVPTLLGLKGNIEMTLASRVSTQVQLGNFDSFKSTWSLFWGNMAIIQCQSAVMGLVASLFAVFMSVSNNGLQVFDALLLCASSLTTAFIVCTVLGSLTVFLVIISQKCRINPDNFATPIAASIGDFMTLVVLAYISDSIYKLPDGLYISLAMTCIFVLLIPLWAYLSYRNSSLRKVLYYGWFPVILALIITSAGGYILQSSVAQFKGYALLVPVINGVADNLVTVQASRISTYLHQNGGDPGKPFPQGSTLCVSPFGTFFGKCVHAPTARILLSIVIPGHVIFYYILTLVEGAESMFTYKFILLYLAFAFIQVTVLLYVARNMIHACWRLGFDPDNAAIPLVTALDDLTGTLCLSAVFSINEII